MRCALKMALFFMLTCTMASPAQAGGEYIAELKALSGEVWVTVPPSVEESAARAPSKLVAGTRIRTGAQSSAEVIFPDGSQLKIRSNSAMQLSGHKRRGKKKHSVLLFFGRLWNKVVTTVGAEPSYEITTANAVCGVRGTEFETAVGEDGSVRVRVKEGSVHVGGDSNHNLLVAGQETQANEGGVAKSRAISVKPRWRAWHHAKLRRLGHQARPIIDGFKRSAQQRKSRISKLRGEQQHLVSEHKRAKDRLQMGDPRAADDIRNIQKKLSRIADKLADEGDRVSAQAGLIDRFSDIASDPRFKMLDRKYLEIEAASLRRVQKSLDKLVREGMDISAKAMDNLMDEMRHKKGTLKEKKGSTMDELFGPGSLGGPDLR